MSTLASQDQAGPEAPDITLIEGLLSFSHWVAYAAVFLGFACPTAIGRVQHTEPIGPDTENSPKQFWCLSAFRAGGRNVLNPAPFSPPASSAVP